MNVRQQEIGDFTKGRGATAPSFRSILGVALIVGLAAGGALFAALVISQF